MAVEKDTQQNVAPTVDLGTMFEDMLDIIHTADLTPKVVQIREGAAVSVKDDIVTVGRLPVDVQFGEMVTFEDGTRGMIQRLQQDGDRVSAVVTLAEKSRNGIVPGTKVEAIGIQMSVPVGEALLGRVINPLGDPQDDEQLSIQTDEFRPIEREAPQIFERSQVNRPLLTGILSIDSMVPIGRGQRELIIGDRRTGKTAIAIDTIVNQHDVICIYVAVGKKKREVAQIVETLGAHRAMDHTIVVVAPDDSPATMQYIAPYAGCAIGEYFMDKGKDVLVVYDDLTKHAWAYRSLALALRRPPGREAYPGDIFYLHSRLLERACQLKTGGSMTALPIIETLDGDFSAYIPTNVISITDGQLYFDADRVNRGQFPAISYTLSVSRLGSQVQTEAMKRIGKSLRVDMAQAEAEFVRSQLVSVSALKPETRRILEFREQMIELFNQPEGNPLPHALQLAFLYAVKNGFTTGIVRSEIPNWQRELTDFLKIEHKGLMNELTLGTSIPEQELRRALAQFNDRHQLR